MAAIVLLSRKLSFMTPILGWILLVFISKAIEGFLHVFLSVFLFPLLISRACGTNHLANDLVLAILFKSSVL